MEEWLLNLAFLLLSLILLVIGLLVATSPEAFMRFLFWISKAYGFTTARDFEGRPIPYLSWRLPGAGLAVAGLIFTSLILTRIFSAKSAQISITTPPAAESSQLKWYYLASGALWLLSGVLVVVKPQAILRWMIRRTQHREADDMITTRVVIFARVIGFLWIAGSVFFFRFLFR